MKTLMPPIKGVFLGLIVFAEQATRYHLSSEKGRDTLHSRFKIGT